MRKSVMTSIPISCTINTRWEKTKTGTRQPLPGQILFDSSVRSELIKSWEAGFDVRFIQNRLGLDFAWYKTNATRQLLNLPLDPFAGYSSRKVNAR